MADALLDDLDDLSDVEPEEEQSFEDKVAEENDIPTGGNGDGNDQEANGIDYATTTIAPTKQRPRLLDDASLKSHLASVRAVKSTDDQKPSANNGSDTSKEEDEHQHALILASNKQLASLGHEIHRTHLELCQLYHPKFPELEELLTDVYQYRQAIGIIQNEMDVTKSNEELNDILTSN